MSGGITFESWYKTINVKDYGATGDGSTDDTSAIQAALNAAFGSAASPHGTGDDRFLNKSVYFPAGKYRTTAPLVVTNVNGARIYGAGSLSTNLFYNGAIGADITPILKLNGFNYSKLEGLSFTGVSDPTDHFTCCIQIFADLDDGGNNANANTFSDIVTANTSHGILLGHPTGEAVSENVFINCTHSNHEYAGFKVLGANTLDMTIINGGCNGCGDGYWVATGSIPVIMNAAFAGNTGYDIRNDAADCMSVIGCRSESINFLKSGGPALVSGCLHTNAHPLTPGKFVDAGSTGKITVVGCKSVDGVFAGDNQAELYILGSTFGATNAITSGLFTGFTGRVAAMPLPPGDYSNVAVVSLLPTAAAKCKGLRMMVTDSTVAMSGHYGDIVSGSGSNTVPVFCDGTNWRIG